MTKVVSENEIDLLVEALKKGMLVAFPTETVYGLAVIYNNKDALDRLFIAKNRPSNKSVTLMVADKEEIKKYAVVSEDAQKIINRFMPGRITLIFKKQDSVDQAMTCGKETIGIRIPDHPFVLKLLQKTGPLLVTSANLSGYPNTTNTQEVIDQLDNRIDYIVEGIANSTIASTVVDVTDNKINILREGHITLKEIEGELS